MAPRTGLNHVTRVYRVRGILAGEEMLLPVDKERNILQETHPERQINSRLRSKQ